MVWASKMRFWEPINSLSNNWMGVLLFAAGSIAMWHGYSCLKKGEFTSKFGLKTTGTTAKVFATAYMLLGLGAILIAIKSWLT